MATNKLKRERRVQFAEQMAFYEKAREMGFFSLNQQEKKLIDLLRYTTYHGRNIVIDTAVSMRRTHPWRDGFSMLKSNTQTTYPDNGLYFCPEAGEDTCSSEGFADPGVGMAERRDSHRSGLKLVVTNSAVVEKP